MRYVNFAIQYPKLSMQLQIWFYGVFIWEQIKESHIDVYLNNFKYFVKKIQINVN